MKQATKTKQQSIAKRTARVLAVVLVGTFFAFGSGLFAYGQALKGKIYPGVTIAGIDLGGLSFEEAKAKLAEEVIAEEMRGITLEAFGKELRPSLGDLGVTIDVTGSIGLAFRVGRNNALVEQFAIPSLGRNFSIPLIIQDDPAVRAEYFETLNRYYGSPAIDANLLYDHGAVFVQPSKPGYTVVRQDFTSEILEAARRLEPFHMALTTAVVQPSITEKDLAPTKTKVEQMIADPLTLTYQHRRYTVQTERIASWMTAPGSDDGSAAAISSSLDPKKVGAYLDELNADIGVAPKPALRYDAPFHGEYAWKNQEGKGIWHQETIETITTALNGDSPKIAELVVGAIDPVFTEATVTAPHPTGKSIAVDLQKQTLFAFEDGKLIFWTRASTGRWPYSTPTGEWKIYGKTAKQVMAGPGYRLPNVKWVLPYNGDYTLHGTYWHTKFGQPMSHGCTNLSEADAKWVYDWATVGVPVTIY